MVLFFAYVSPTSAIAEQHATYQQAEKQFLLDKSQYEQYGTILSLETLISSSKAAQLARIRVIKQYFSEINEELSKFNSKETVQRVIDSNTSFTATLSSAEEKITSAEGYVELDVLSEAFAETKSELETRALFSQLLIRIERMDRALAAVQREIETANATPPAELGVSLRQNEIVRLISKNTEQQTILMNSYVEDLDLGKIDTSRVDQYVLLLAEMHADLKKVLTYIRGEQ